MTGKPREPRPKAPSEVPLDDGPREGTHAWREVAGVEFCHWDRWLLRLSLDEPEGLRSIAKEFRRRARVPVRTNDVAEAMLAQIADLETRLANLGRTPVALLDDAERTSTWLREKAFRRVWHATSIRRTAAMRHRARHLLAARAREGNWAAFPVSPAPYFARLRAVVGDGYYDYRAVGLVMLRLEHEESRLLATARNDDERLAIVRATLGASIEFMGQVHGLLSRLPERAADLAIREIAQILVELRAAGLECQRGKARRLRTAALRAADVAVVTEREGET